MAFEWNNMIVVTKEDLVPAWFSESNLKVTIHRFKDKPYGIKKVQSGGNGRAMLISYDSLPGEIKAGLGDPRKVDHILEKYYKWDGEAVSFFAAYQFEDGSYLDTIYQERYIINASVLKAVIALRSARETELRTKSLSLVGIMTTLCADATSFNKLLKAKHGVEHTLPESPKRFKEALKAFETNKYPSLVSAKHKNSNSRKVTDATLQLLNNMFGKDKTKPTATEVYRQYAAFLSGYLEVINSDGEVYDPKSFKKLSAATVTNYMAQWANKIGTYAARSGDRQKLMQLFKTPHSLERPKFAGAIISIDDRQPPFKCLDGRRVWFYNGIDLASEAFTCWVYGRDKEGLILDFYRQLVRNYAGWGMNLPAELEAEMSLNSSYVNTFLRPGAMFQNVRIEANNARGKRIEAYFKQLRYAHEKKREDWLARPFALSESNQAGSGDAKEQPYDAIIEGCLKDIETWNNWPHSDYPEAIEDFNTYGSSDKSYKSRWEMFCENQHPDLRPTNYQSILPFIGYQTSTSCNVGQIKLQHKLFLLGDAGQVCKGDKLISLMKQVEGQDIDVYWLDDHNGQVLKALVFKGSQYICEAVAKPTYNRAKIEQTPQDEASRVIMSSYVSTIEKFARHQKASLEFLTLLNNAPAPRETFVMPGMKKARPVETFEDVEVLEEVLEGEDDFSIQGQSFVRSIKDRF